MNIKLIKEREAPLLSRKRLIFEIDYSGSRTPSKRDIKKTVASLQKVKEDLVSIRHIYPRFGSCKAKIITHIYKTPQDLKKYEPQKKKEEKAEAAPTEAPKEAPKEEKKEAAPKEEKPKEEKAEEKVDAKEKSKE